ncbi:MAG: extracellular solute-binding protein [Oscillospiraceae bacterium]|jgi:hypothetical protein|nr:extracellular solute-binding protein [Oscillospiraceae bacterium]
MKRVTLFIALLLALTMASAAFASVVDVPGAPLGTAGQGKYDGGARVIRVAGWYDRAYPYFSGMEMEDLDGYFTSPESYEVRYERLKEIEEKYNVRFEAVRTTFEGAQISIDEGILSGRPEADIYEVDINFAMTYALNEYVYALEDITLPDDDVFTTQQIFQGLKFPSQDKTYMWQDYVESATVYMLGFNWTLLQSKGLENPQDLWDRGEWTWDVFLDYCAKLTDLTANPPVYGFTGFWTNHLNGFLRSNGAQIAATPEGGLMSAATGEVLDLYKQMYQDLKIARPWNTEDWASNNYYSDGSAAFFTAANWILNDSGSAGSGGGMDHPLNFEIGVVPYPVGPSGNQATNTHNSVNGNYYMIPKGVEDPALVYAAWRDLINWYDGDFENTKQYDVLDPDDLPLTWNDEILITCAHGDDVLAENNIRLNHMMARSVSFDPWESMTSLAASDTQDFGLSDIMTGDMTPAQFQETFKQPMENALKTVYK